MKFVLLTIQVSQEDIVVRTDLIEAAVRVEQDGEPAFTRVYIVNGNGYYDVSETPGEIMNMVVASA